VVTSIGYAYPWDVVGDPAAVDRIAALGVSGVALAAAYHTTRAATPQHPVHRVVDARHAALYLPVRDRAWRGRLRPASPHWTAPDAFLTAATAVRAAGLPVHAWVVLTHNSRLGAEHPDLVVRNAFGDAYPYALCPSHSDVIDYCRTLVSEVVALGEPDGIVLEACGPLGFSHGGHHEKTDGADWGAVHQQLLSLCVCPACVARYRADGVDAADLVTRIRAGVDDPDTASVPDALGEWAQPVSRARTSVVRELRQLLVAEARAQSPRIRVTLHASADPWATGPFATVAPDLAAPADALVVTCWPGPDQGVANIAAMRALAPDTAVGGYVLGLPPRPADPTALRAEFDRYRAAGVAELHVYHTGLASPARLAALRTALA
jgi:hypothetical protein